MSKTDVFKSNSDRCQSCASLFLHFKDNLPASAEHSVTSIVKELFGVSRALLDLRKSVEDPRYDAYLDIIEKDRDTVSRSVTHTLRDVQKHANVIEELNERGLERTERAKEAYQVTMKKIISHFGDEGERIRGCETLTARLETYEQFLHDLKDRLVGDTPSRDFKDMRYRLEKLLQIQEKNFEESIGLGRLSLGPDVPKFEKQKSWERKRPSRERPQRPRPEREEELRLRPQRTDQHRPQAERRRQERLKPYDSPDEWEQLHDSTSDDADDLRVVDYVFEDDDDYHHRPEIVRPSQPGRHPGMAPAGMQSPFSPNRLNAPSMGYFQPKPSAPEPPQPAAFGYDTPSSSGATPSTLSSASHSSDSEHWLPVVFRAPRPSTTFRTSGSESGCFGESDPAVQSELRDHYDRLLKFPFTDAHLELSIYVRAQDRRAKILVSQSRGNRRLVACEAAANLRIIRHESCLQLCQPVKPDRRDRRERADTRGKVFLWTMLRFTTYERMVTFWCTMHALKAQDEHAALDRLEDATLDGEVCLYSGVIDDDNYQHALHLLRDRDSKGMRLQASALTGQMKRCPIWTAFITYQAMSPHWARRVENKKIHLQDLTRFVFTDAHLYEPPVGPSGEHEIKFHGSGEARRFYETLQGIAAGKI